MRENITDISKGLLKGILPVTGTNLEGLYSCKNARPCGVGMEYVVPFTPYLDLVGVYPFPQLMVTDKFQYVGTPTGLYEVVNDSLVLKKTQAATTHYDVADFKDSVAIVGNGHTLFRDSSGGLISVENVPEASVCNSFNGLLLLGNISSWNQPFDVDKSTLVWAARPLSTEFRLSIDDIPTGAGYIKLFCGDILKIISHPRQLMTGSDKQVIVFGTNGISILNLVTTPVTSFSVAKEIRHSITDKESITQTNEGIFFVDTLGYLCMFDISKGDVTKIGLKHFLYGKRTTSFFNTEDSNLVLCNGEESFLISELGIGSLAQITTSGGLIGNTFQVVGEPPSTYDMQLITCPQDMNYNAKKTVYMREYNIVTDGSCKADNVRMGPDSVGTKILTQSSFSFTLDIASLTYAQVTGLIIRWKLTDKRYVRGRNDY